MPTYTIDMRGDPASNAWAEGASALAQAFTPDYESRAKGQVMAAQADSAYARSAAALAQRDKTMVETAKLQRVEDAWNAYNSQVADLDLTPEDHITLFMEAAPGLGVDLTDVDDYIDALGRGYGLDLERREELAGTEWADTRAGAREILDTQGQQAIDRIHAAPIETGSGVFFSPNDPRAQTFGQFAPAGIVDAGDTALFPHGEVRQTGVGKDGFPTYGVMDTFTAPGEPKADSRAAKNYHMPDGTNYITLDGVTNAQTGEPLPPGGVIGSVNADSAGGLGTQGERTDFSFLSRMELANQDMDASLETMGGKIPDSVSYWLSSPKEGMAAQIISNMMVDDDTKAFMASAQQFLSAILRKDSGAAVPVSEYPMYYTQFIPMPGDGPETMRRKARARLVAMQALERGLGAEGDATEILLAVRNAMGEDWGVDEDGNDILNDGGNTVGVVSIGPDGEVVINK